MHNSKTKTGWAEGEFGGAALGNRLRVRRLVAMAAGCAERPAGKVTEVFSNGSEREGAYRFLENVHTDVNAILAAAHEAGAKRCADAPFAYVPIDQSTLIFTDRLHSKGLGRVGRRSLQGRGLEVLSALAVTPDGAPQGLVGQKYWKRSRIHRRKQDELKRRATADKETQHWLDVIAAARSALVLHAPSTKPWFQLDRAGDAWPLLLQACLDNESWFTTRAVRDRRVRTDAPAQQYLWDEVHRNEPLGSYVVDVVGSSNRRERRATMMLQSARVTLDLKEIRTGKRMPITMWAVLASECSRPPTGEEPLEWMLLTTYPADTLEAVGYVVLGYAQRWRVEEFHKAWKTGACNVEDSQLRDAGHLLPWLVILASVAVRILRMTYLARARPDAPATTEFDAREIRAVIILAKPRQGPAGAVPTIKQMVTWVAQLGGYTGTASGGPPGALVIARGLDRLQLAFQLLACTEEKHDQC
jgi:hypothetical protein